ncbi:hypothetical protein PHYNN_50 [Pantoea phage Phynn]|nr:hypothetical protein PHYNN_50 [Pantoea phage Phynn]
MSYYSASPKAVNYIRTQALEWVENFRNNESTCTDIVTPAHLDSLESRLLKEANARFGENMWPNTVREHIVAAMSGEYGLELFGIEPTVKLRVISDKAIKKYTRKK